MGRQNQHSYDGETAQALSQDIKPEPPVDNPHGIPSAVLNQLANELLPDKESYSRRLNELLKAIQQNGGSDGR